MYNKQQYLLLNILKEEKLFNLLIATHAIIAGGAIRAVFAREFISDYDIYFKNTIDLDSFESGLKELDFELAFSSDTAKSYKKNNIKIQVIIMPELIKENPKDIIDQFDYSVCMGAYDFDTQSFFLADSFLEHVARKELYYNVNCKYPLSSMFRLKKYFKKGYTISGSEIIKLGLAVNNLKMKDYRDLKVQLQGIDTLFLKELTDKLMTPEYAEKSYDFNEFMGMITEYFENKLEDVFSE
jgi:hypothetical protein